MLKRKMSVFVLSFLTLAATFFPSGHAAFADGPGYYTVMSNGEYVNMRSGPSTRYGIMLAYKPGSFLYVDCYKHGAYITGYYGTSNIWNHVYDPNLNTYGYISDTYMYTGSSSPVVPMCHSDR
ncbi:hypothetical protein [Bacillus toyonensis]|uniref:SH3b domain-containing protein n=1 Tax=Bacillus toyonensis TaxID=155322 RepID=A0A2A8H1N5_9BACI|nr:hypothetical protein [Bacillus toyonensis]PEP85932.1 hypothetical protein CN585_30395 [Bacillus toyonensis]